ncbi:MAG: SWIM zinc finger domain-containing protein [Pirellulales bacterium]|nr:SWIM zinc finger domain-containing protein [Pirellulales bacterium]
MSSEKRGKKQENKAANGWASLTWDDLDRWAGSRSVSRGRSYENQGRVKGLAISEDGRLLATVHGGERYVVSVWLVAGKKLDKIDSQCTCPVGLNCKHAVATVAAYLQALTDGVAVPLAKKNDPRWNSTEDEYEDDFDEWDDEEEDEEESYDEEKEDEVVIKAKPAKRGRPPRKQTRAEWDEKIKQHILAKSREELAEQVLSLVQRFPELREEFRERLALSEGDVDRLVNEARREIRDRTEEFGWRNHWQGDGHTPDYSRLKHRLERLVELGHADQVVELGREFIKRANDQVGQSDDEGETAMAAAECLPVMFAAVEKSTLTGPRKILFAIDACLLDEYDMVDDSANVILDAKWKPVEWSVVADELAKRLPKPTKSQGDAWHRNYERDRISDWMIRALENAGREEELPAIYETEARATESYVRLVRYLIANKRFEDAGRWAKEGIEKTREKSPGIASSLATLLCEVSRNRKQWNVVAAHAAWQFFDRPGTSSFDELMTVAEKAKCGKQVRAAAVQFLETGKSPFDWIASPKEGQKLRVDSAWPLPVLDYLVPLMQPQEQRYAPQGPHYDILLDMAIAAKKPNDVLTWYDKMVEGRKGGARGFQGYSRRYDDSVAAAVAESHPQLALDIYRKGLEGVLPQAQASAYESAAGYLKKMRPIMKALDRELEWNTMVADIRQKYRNRPKFIELLDRLDGRTILQTKKARAGRR